MRLVLPFTTAIVLTAVSAITFARGAEVSAGAITVTSAWARATPPGAKVGAAYLSIENRGEAEDRIVGVTTPAAASVSVHETITENGVAKMQPLADLSIKAGAALELQPGGVHLMLIGLSGPLREGDPLTVTVDFAGAGSLTVPVAVLPIGAAGPDAHQEHGT